MSSLNLLLIFLSSFICFIELCLSDCTTDWMSCGINVCVGGEKIDSKKCGCSFLGCSKKAKCRYCFNANAEDGNIDDGNAAANNPIYSPYDYHNIYDYDDDYYYQYSVTDKLLLITSFLLIILIFGYIIKFIYNYYKKINEESSIKY